MAVRKKLPLSGNKLSDWIFKRLIDLLETKVEFIFKTREALRWPNNRKITIYGFVEYLFAQGGGDKRKIIIFISGQKNKHPTKDDMGKTLVHELCHYLFEIRRERKIMEIEKILWACFTPEQKSLIKSYIPKHTVKQQPEK